MSESEKKYLYFNFKEKHSTLIKEYVNVLFSETNYMNDQQ